MICDVEAQHEKRELQSKSESVIARSLVAILGVTMRHHVINVNVTCSTPPVTQQLPYRRHHGNTTFETTIPYWMPKHPRDLKTHLISEYLIHEQSFKGSQKLIEYALRS